VLGTARLAAYLARSLQRSFQESFPALLSSYCVRTMSEQRVPPVPCHGGCAVGQLSSGCGPGVFRTSLCNLQEQLQSHVPLSLLLLLLFLGEFFRSSCLSRCPAAALACFLACRFSAFAFLTACFSVSCTKLWAKMKAADCVHECSMSIAIMEGKAIG